MASPRDIANSGPRPLTIADQQERSDLYRAEGHAIARNRLVARVFCYISVMRAASCIADKSRAVIAHPDVAVPQDFNATNGNQAAHILPGCLSIENAASGPKGLWEMAPSEEIRNEIRGHFEATHDLPVSFNKADSAAEGRISSGPPGLKQIFQECCQYILEQHPPTLRSGERIIVVDRPVVYNAYHMWVEASVASCLRAARGKSGRILSRRPPDVHDNPRTDLARGVHNEWTIEDLEARGRDRARVVHRAKTTVEEFGNQESYLRAYARATTPAFPFHETIIHEIELPFGRPMPEWYSR